MARTCTECIQGSIHNGLPVGKVETVHGLDTYVVGNRTNPRAIVVMYTDVFGLELPNNKLIADAYAKSGEYLVYMPDFFKADPVGLKVADILIPVDAAKQSTFSKYTGILSSIPAFIVWTAKHGHAQTDKDCMAWLGALRRATPKAQRIGMVGFCWGGRYASRAGLRENMIDVDGEKVPLVEAVVALHPSHLAVPQDVEGLVVPASFGWGIEDTMTRIEMKGKVEDTHAKAEASGAKLPEMDHQTYSPGRHGFGVRGNPDDPKERACLEQSEKQVLDWFQRWL